MKLLPLALWLSLSAIHLQATTLPVLEDTSSKNGLVSKKSGAAGNLTVGPDRPAFIRFDLQPFGESLAPTDSVRARLTFYVQKVVNPGTITLQAITSDWTESPAASTSQPMVDSEALATASIGADASKQFVTVDVTAQVVEWLASPETNFGVAVQTDGTASILLGAKEGPGSGYPAVLDIEKKSSIGNDFVLAGIDAIKLGTGNVDNAEFAYLDGLTSSIQLQLGELSSGLDAVEILTATIGDKVNKAGDTMTGHLILPANGLTLGTDQLTAALGRVGIGTASPAAKLDVRGDIKLGSNGQLFAPGGDENLRIVRGTVRYSSGTLTIVAGSGFTVTGPSGGSFTINFNSPFSSTPTITTTGEFPSSITTLGIRSVTTGSAIALSGAALDGASVHFIAIGPR